MRRIVILMFLVSGISNAQVSSEQAGDSLYARGNYATAINSYAKSPILKSKMQIARAYHMMGNYEKSILQYQHIVKNNKQLQLPQFELGKLLFKRKKEKEAKLLFTDLVEKDSLNPEYFYYLGRTTFGSKAAMELYKKAITLDSTHLRSLYRLSKAYLEIQYYHDAIKYADLGLVSYENSGELLNIKAQSYFKNNDYAEAIPIYERLIELGIEKDHILFSLGHCYHREWEFEKGIALYEKMIADDFEGTNYRVWLDLGGLYMKKKEYDKAIECINTSIEIKAVTFEKEYSALASAYSSKKAYAKTIKYHEKAHKEEPDNFRHLFYACVIVDNYYTDDAKKLAYFERFKNKYPKLRPSGYYMKYVNQKISKLKENMFLSEKK